MAIGMGACIFLYTGVECASVMLSMPLLWTDVSGGYFDGLTPLKLSVGECVRCVKENACCRCGEGGPHVARARASRGGWQVGVALACTVGCQQLSRQPSESSSPHSIEQSLCSTSDPDYRFAIGATNPWQSVDQGCTGCHWHWHPGPQPREEELDSSKPTRPEDWKPKPGQGLQCSPQPPADRGEQVAPTGAVQVATPRKASNQGQGVPSNG
ncbi:hypothetical protein HaLaN_19794, partial [Haematococcus lacustris]